MQVMMVSITIISTSFGTAKLLAIHAVESVGFKLQVNVTSSLLIMIRWQYTRFQVITVPTIEVHGKVSKFTVMVAMKVSRVCRKAMLALL